MSSWTYISGTIEVSPYGKTQHEKEYTLKTTLDHLPVVTGSERDMEVDILPLRGYDEMSSCDEFGEVTNNLRDKHGRRNRKRGWMYTQSKYILVINSSLRDRDFFQTYKEFIKWICRLAKRIQVESVLIKIKWYDKSIIIENPEIGCGPTPWETVYGQMLEDNRWQEIFAID